MKKAKRKKSRRCIKRYSLKINHGKWLMLSILVDAFCRQKDEFLLRFCGLRNIEQCRKFRDIRNALVLDSYKSRFGLQARGWKLALKVSSPLGKRGHPFYHSGQDSRNFSHHSRKPGWEDSSANEKSLRERNSSLDERFPLKFEILWMSLERWFSEKKEFL